MKKGFTLIELLAVIVILAIIATIATPIVINIIEDTQISAAQISVKKLEKAAELYYYENEIDKKFVGITFNCNEGKCKSETGEELEVSGNVPEVGTIVINKDGKVKLSSIIMKGYSCVSSGESYKCIKAQIPKIANETTAITTIPDSATTTLKNLKIYGNSYQKTRSGKNLFGMDYRTATIDETDANQWVNTTVRNFEFDKYYIGFAASNYNVPSNVSYKVEGDSIFISTTLGAYGIAVPIKVKSNTSYALYKGDCEDEIGIGTYDKDGNFIGCKDIPIGVKNYTFTTDANTEIITLVLVPSEANVYKEYKNIQLEEGSTFTGYEKYGESPSSKYPSKIESVGDLVTDETNEYYGKYEIPITVYGKNLFKMIGREVGSTITGYNNSHVRDFDFNKYYVGLTNNNYNVPNNVSYKIEGDSVFVSTKIGGYGVGFPIKVKSNTNYVLYYRDCEDEIGIGTYDKDGNYLGTQSIKDNKFTTGENVEIITIVLKPAEFNVYKEYKNIQLEEGTEVTQYEVAKKQEYSIYLDEPLRCLEDVCDYIDFEKQKVIRNIEWIDNTGTKTIEESLMKLSKPKEEEIDIPNIQINEGVTHILVGTSITPSNVELQYYK